MMYVLLFICPIILISFQFNRRVYPGQMRYVAKNFFTAIVVIDPTSQSSVSNAVAVYNMINQNLPVRVGFVLVSSLQSVHASLTSYRHKTRSWERTLWRLWSTWIPNNKTELLLRSSTTYGTKQETKVQRRLLVILYNLLTLNSVIKVVPRRRSTYAHFPNWEI